MARLKGYRVDQLRMLLDRAEDAGQVEQLMLAIAYKQGASVGASRSGTATPRDTSTSCSPGWSREPGTARTRRDWTD